MNMHALAIIRTTKSEYALANRQDNVLGRGRPREANVGGVWLCCEFQELAIRAPNSCVGSPFGTLVTPSLFSDSCEAVHRTTTSDGYLHSPSFRRF